MKKLLFGMAFSGLISSASVLAVDSDELWEMTSKMDMPGMVMPATTHTICLPKGEAYRPEKNMPQNDPQQKNCEMTDIKVSGNTTKWKMRCSGKDAMEGNGEMTRTADTMHGRMMISMSDMKMTQATSGKRVGTCHAK